MDNFEILQTQFIHVELSSKCNAGCPMCSRHVTGTNKPLDTLYTASISHKQWVKFMDDLDGYMLPELEFQFCGCLGDPCMTPDFFEICHETYNRGYMFQTTTNGSIGAASKWAELGKICYDKKNQVIFALDGLEDTNHLYRVGISWDKIMKNAKAFIDAGGYATWKMIIFDHNKHQVEEARELAREMGFKEFYTHYSSRNHARGKDSKVEIKVETKKKQELIPLIDTVDEASKLYEDHVEKNTDTTITCDAKKQNRFFIDADFKFWPCMYIGTGRATVKDFYERISPKDREWNSLDLYDIDQIMEHDFMRGLDEGNWCSICYAHCQGAKHRKLANASTTKVKL